MDGSVGGWVDGGHGVEVVGGLTFIYIYPGKPGEEGLSGHGPGQKEADRVRQSRTGIREIDRVPHRLALQRAPRTQWSSHTVEVGRGESSGDGCLGVPGFHASGICNSEFQCESTTFQIPIATARPA
jgi:hypothetical protein